jgi:hypothetical protein
VTRNGSGMKALADYIHAKGLKFGIYSDAGSRAVALLNRTGSEAGISVSWTDIGFPSHGVMIVTIKP